MPLSILQALDCIDNTVMSLYGEIIPIEEAAGRISQEDYTAHFDLPRFDNSAMDGYAVIASDANKTVELCEVVYAGDAPNILLEKGKAVKIMTGAPVPEGCETIVPKEDVVFKDNKVQLPDHINMGNFIRRTGEDIASGETFLRKGEPINAYTIASLASQGISHVCVTRKIKVAIFGTGDELRPHFEKIEPHQLYNSNSPMFLARARLLGCEVRYIRTSADTLEALKRSITSTLDSDIIITSGGVSVGDKDFTKEAFRQLGMQVHFDGVDIKPGRPTIFGTLGTTAVVNLPGNPLASMVNFELFVRAVIRKMSGRDDSWHGTVTTKLKQDVKLKGGKFTALLGTFDGSAFEPLGNQKPGMVSPMQKADGMILLTPDVKGLSQGTEVKMLPIAWEYTKEEKEELFSC